MTTRDQFPILRGNTAIPWFVVEARRAQAYVNHGQSLEQLADRGGLAWAEMLAVLENRPWKQQPADEAKRRVMVIVNREVARKGASV